MSKTAHTPGPWKASPTEPPGDWCIHAPSSPWQLAYVAASTQVEWPLEANARLIAAAPEMLDALQKITDMNVQYAIDRYGDAKEADTMSCVQIARAAIAKATGAA